MRLSAILHLMLSNNRSAIVFYNFFLRIGQTLPVTHACTAATRVEIMLGTPVKVSVYAHCRF